MSTPLHVNPVECGICLFDIITPNAARLCCSGNAIHWFHMECVLRWFETSPTCPTCRQSYTVKAIDCMRKSNGQASYSQASIDETIEKINSKIRVLEMRKDVAKDREEKKRYQRLITQLILIGDELVNPT